MNKKFFILFFLSAFVIVCTVAAKDSLVYKKTLTLDKIKNYNSDSLSFKQSLSSIMLKYTFGIVFNKEYTKQTHDSVFLERLTEMNLITEYNYAYNDIVLERIKRYCYKYRPYISKLLINIKSEKIEFMSKLISIFSALNIFLYQYLPYPFLLLW